MAPRIILCINFLIRQFAIYYGIPVFLLGVIGGFLNIIVFISLKTFRQSSCAFYLMIMSAFDLGQFFSSTLPNILSRGFAIDWALSSLFFCKIKVFIFSTCSLSSMTCLCLAIIDQYFATSSRPRWQKWCNIKLAHRLTSFFIIMWTLHGIPYFIFYDHIIVPSTNATICQITNKKFIQYHTYGYFLALNNLLPLITAVFGLLAYHNARNLAYRTVPLVRRELDKQLTVMVLVQVLINFCTFLPYSIESMFALIIKRSDPISEAKILLASIITSNLSLLSFAV
jgi:uncharacterized membrane protein YciS (DUF1049 family)